MELPCPAPFISGITACDNLTGYFFLPILMETDFTRVDVFSARVSWFSLEQEYGAN